mmetsp:Transcript_7108/g.8599  ORF Transcript_7108/g.8599 Transcript_7108/m.8599 type:complete len:92 (-) Transcript_7108:1148-1423(-)
MLIFRHSVRPPRINGLREMIGQYKKQSQLLETAAPVSDPSTEVENELTTALEELQVAIKRQEQELKNLDATVGERERILNTLERNLKHNES